MSVRSGVLAASPAHCEQIHAFRVLRCGGTFDDRGQVRDEIGGFVGRYIPDDEVIHAAVIVDEAVAHSGHFAPFESGQLGASVFRHFLRSLPDDFETAHKGAFEHSSARKSSRVIFVMWVRRNSVQKNCTSDVVKDLT